MLSPSNVLFSRPSHRFILLSMSIVELSNAEYLGIITKIPNAWYMFSSPMSLNVINIHVQLVGVQIYRNSCSK